MTPRIRAIWRLAMLLVSESRKSHASSQSASASPIDRVLRSISSGAPAREASALSSRVPLLQNLSGILSMASDVLASHPALSEAAVRVALAELRALNEPLEGDRLMHALAAAMPPGQSGAVVDIESTPERRGIAEQTHRGRVVLSADANTKPVAARITLIRTDTRRELAQDLDVAVSAARLAERFSRDAREMHASGLVTRLGQVVTNMLDVRQRAADQSYLRYRLSEVNRDERVIVPEVFWDLCSDTVLVTRSVRNVPLSDTAGLRAHGLDPAEIVATWIETFFEIAMGEGVFHAGLEAASAAVSVEADTLGRLVLDGDSPLTFFAAHERQFMVTGSDALLRGDHKTVAREHMRQGSPGDHGPQHEMHVESTYRREAERFGGGNTLGTHRHRSVADLFTALGKGSIAHPFGDAHAGIASRAALLARSAQGIEDMARRIAPDIDVWTIGRRVIMRLALDQFGRHGVFAHLASEIVHWPQTVPRVPNLLADWVMRQNRKSLHRDARR